MIMISLEIEILKAQLLQKNRSGNSEKKKL